MSTTYSVTNSSAERTHEPVLWFSYSKAPSNVGTPDTKSILISVVLDAGIWADFSGIQVLVVYKKNEWLDNVVIEDRLVPRESGIGKAASIRDMLIRHRSTVERSKHIINKNGNVHTLPLCTVVFELIDVSTWRAFLVDLVPRLDTSDSALCVGYSRAYPCTSTSHSVHLFLRTNVSFRGISKLPAFNRNSLRRPPAYCHYSHNVRILPISGERSSCPKLPPDIILQVALYAVGLQKGPWRFTLLSLGLVCKSWSHVVDLFFRLHDSNNYDKATAAAVARSLEANPERGRLIRHFDPMNYVEIPREANEAFLGRCTALLKIITLATSVAEVRLMKIHVSAVQDFIVALSRLRKVKRCIIGGIHLSIDDVQTFIAKWTNLRSLNISFWNYDDPEHVDFKTIAPDKEVTIYIPMCNLQFLTLDNGYLTGIQLLRFIQPHPILQRLTLYRVRGLWNSDLCAFLTVISSTLLHLTLRECVTPRLPDEEYALDAVMPSFSSLKTLTVSGDNLSSLAIARKSSSASRCSLSVDDAPGLSCYGLLEALKIGSWGTVYITWRSYLTDAEEAFRRQAADVARANNIKLTCYLAGSGQWVPPHPRLGP